MSKRKKSILKPLILSILSFLIILVVVIYAFDKDRGGKQSTTENSQQSVEPSPNTPTELGERQKSETA